MTFRQFTKFSLSLSLLLVVASLIVFFKPGPKFSIEFTGGTLIEIQTTDVKTREEVLSALHKYEETSKKSLGSISVTSVKTATEQAFVIRFRPMENEEYVGFFAGLQKDLGGAKELKHNTIGPSVSASLKKQSLEAIAIASFLIILYLSFSFRNLPRRLKPWKVGVIAVIAFLHDIIVTIGVFTVIGFFTSFEFDTLFVTALLTILAYSANEAIIVFDRIRANLNNGKPNEDLGTVVSAALRQCLQRTIGTTVCILIMLLSLFFLGSESIRWFVLALIFGSCIGVYSSYFVAAPLLVYWKDNSGKKNKR
jgi:preprotein translocase subunit SecF